MPEILRALLARATPWSELAAAACVGVALHLVVGLATRAILKRTRSDVDDGVWRRCSGPAALLLPCICAQIAAAATHAPHAVSQILTVLITLGVGWLLTRLVRVGEDVVFHRVQARPEEVSGRKVRTQVRLLRRVLNLLIGLLTVAAVMMMFARVRQVGAGLVASAGVVSLVLGFAAQRALGNLLAGIQIAITQPIREDDAVVVEGEWGWIEEITLTYVVVKLWDLRRLVVPISQFIEKPFQNWTRNSADLLGAVTLQVDYATPVDELREELVRIVKASTLWDEKVAGIQVVDSGERSMTLRALVSASNSARAWDLRCEVREKLIAFLNANHPQALPRTRAQFEGTIFARAAAPGQPNHDRNEPQVS